MLYEKNWKVFMKKNLDELNFDGQQNEKEFK